MLKKTIDLFLYSNMLIAICVVSLLWASELMAYSTVVITPYDALIFASSLFIYSAHRLVGIHKLKNAQINDRHKIIQHIEPLVIALGGLGLIVSVFMFFGLSNMQQVLLIFPGLISLAYIVPFSRKGLRLRDYPFVKIFLIAFTWAWATVVVPMWELQPPGLWWLFFERFFFILAITLPFDIRDLVMDKKQSIKTIPLSIGTRRTKRLSFIVLGISMIIGIIYLLTFSLQYKVLNGYLLSGIFTFYFLNKVRKGANDYLFSGWLDGTMIAQYLFIQTILTYL